MMSNKMNQTSEEVVESVRKEKAKVADTSTKTGPSESPKFKEPETSATTGPSVTDPVKADTSLTTTKSV